MKLTLQLKSPNDYPVWVSCGIPNSCCVSRKKNDMHTNKIKRISWRVCSWWSLRSQPCVAAGVLVEIVSLYTSTSSPTHPQVYQLLSVYCLIFSCSIQLSLKELQNRAGIAWFVANDLIVHTILVSRNSSKTTNIVLGATTQHVLFVWINLFSL